MSERLRRAGIVGVATCALPLAYGYSTASDEVRWVETTCTERDVVDDDGDGLGSVAVPALRPEWQINDTSIKAGPCWIPVPATNRAIGRFSEPPTARVSRWEQVGHAPRLISVLWLWSAIAALYVADAMRRGVKLLPDQRDDD